MSTPSFPALCDSCAHYRSGGTCGAFPGGIPAEIIEEAASHILPWPGQKGDMVWELKPGTEPHLQQWLMSVDELTEEK